VPGRGRPALSFIKWAGGKARVLSQLLPFVPERFGTYYEPMVGAGTLFCKLAPERAVLADINAELLSAWPVIRDDVDALCEALEGHVNTYEHYLQVRAQDPDELPPPERAARFIFLNKTCYNGLYRVNNQGRFNVPYGRKGGANFKDYTNLRRISRKLAGAKLLCEDFEVALADAGEGDLVYLDPPYLDLGRKSRTFHRYQPEAFGEEGHRRLARVFRELDARGCHVVLSNSNVPMARELYAGFHLKVLRTVRTMNSRIKNRSGWSEVVVCNTRPPNC